MSAMSVSSRQAPPTSPASVSRETGVGDAKIAASARSIHSPQRMPAGIGQIAVETGGGGAGHRP